MVERGIDVDHIKQAIQKPDFTKPTFQGRVLVRRKIDSERVIEVIYFKWVMSKKEPEYVIVTAYYQAN